MSVEQLGEESDEKRVLVRSLTDPEGNLVDGEEKEFITQAKFDVVVSTGSGLPFARVERANTAFQLFDRGIIDAEEVLDATDYPNKDAVLQRMQEKAVEAQEAALAQEQQGAIAPQ